MLAAALVCIYPVLGLQTMTDTTHVTVTSPGGRYTVYERVSPGLVYYLGSYTTDDGETPVTYGRYEIDWQADGFTFTGGLTKEKFFSYAL